MASVAGRMLAVEVRTFWFCPNCKLEDVSLDRPLPAGSVVSRFHNCPRLAGVIAPLLPKGTKAKVTAVERGDYVGSDLVRLDGNGRPIMSVITEREDGTDCIVFAPTAVAHLS